MDPANKSVVLVVEDDEAVLDFLTTTLEMEGYEVHAATDGEKGFQMIQTHRPGAVLLDLMLPGIDGLAVLERMAERPEMASIPVTVVSAYADAPQAQEALKRAKNVRRIFTKPVRTEELLRHVKAMIEGQ